MKPYLIGDSAYPSRPYLLKNYKPTNPAFRDQKRFDASINTGRVVIEHAFGALKNRWRILKSFGGNVDKCTTMTIAYCVLHNYCEYTEYFYYSDKGNLNKCFLVYFPIEFCLILV